MNSGTVYIIGAGLAGLAAAVNLAAQGVRVEVFEAAPSAGGRCRSYFEPALGRVIDNGNHLILSGNRAAQDYVSRIGSGACFAGPSHAEFAFADARTGERWMLRPNNGAIPWWILCKTRRVPGTRALDYLGFAGLLSADKGVLGSARPANGPVWDKLLKPMLLAALNTKPEIASRQLVATVLRETLLKGGKACKARIASPTLAAALIDPAVAFIQQHSGALRFSHRLRNLIFDGSGALALDLSETQLPVKQQDRVILAVPPWAAKSLLPDITVPDEFRAIISGHFAIAPLPGTPAMLGVLGATVEWIFAFEDRISVTISDADRFAEMDRAQLAALCWRDVSNVLRLSPDLPPWQIVKEKRATFAATPEQDRKRPDSETRWRNLFLAGDWTNTGLPATIESAVRSGNRAAQLAVASMRA